MSRYLSIVCIAACACAIGAIAITPVFAGPSTVPIPGWDSAGKPGGWNLGDPASVSIVRQGIESTYLHVVVATASANLTAGANLGLPLDLLKGSIIEVSVDIRAKDVSRPLHSYNGVKAMVHVVDPGQADTWAQASANTDSFPVNYDWKRFSFQTTIPPTASSAQLILGLQESSGTADFRNVAIAIVRREAVAPARAPAGSLYTGHAPGALRGVMISPNIQPEDIQTLKEWHVNLVRWQLIWNGFPHSPADNADVHAYDTWLDGCLKHLDEMLPYFKKAGIFVVLDMHTPPGGRDAQSVCRVFTDIYWQEHFYDCWQKMARKYRGERQIWGYDLINEPVLGHVPDGVLDWHDLADKTARKVRQIDSGHAIIIEPDPWGSIEGLSYFQPLDVPGVVYSVHMYEPGQFTHQGVLDKVAVGPVYPGIIGGVQWDKDRIRACFKPAIDYARKFHVAIYIGEFSAVRWAQGADRYIGDVIDVMEENGWDWSYHAFREWQGWSPEVGEAKNITTPSATPTARLRVLLSAFGKNRPVGKPNPRPLP